MISFKHTVSDISGIRSGLIRYARKFSDAVILDSLSGHGIDPDHERPFQLMAGFGSVTTYTGKDMSWEGLDGFLKEHLNEGKHVLGYFSYELRSRIEELSSLNHDRIGFPEIFLMVPEVFVTIKDGVMEITSSSSSPAAILDQLRELSAPSRAVNQLTDLRPLLTREEYLEKIKSLKEHIQHGDIYEVNFCHEYFSDSAFIDPYESYILLGESSPNPFGCFLKYDERYLLCASPERFLRRSSDILISQPMKGTMPRHHDPAIDAEYRHALEHSGKDRSENVMIVDLTRNDFSRIAKRASVKVPELFRVHSFPNVHQMISTVQCEVREDVKISEIIRAAFPMGSMTGAPKVRAMELIEEHEPMKRGIFSGSVGYFAPNGDFDLNVVIRSIMFNAHKSTLSVMAGGAITHLSEPDKEYEESLIKMRPLFETLGYTYDPATGEYA